MEKIWLDLFLFDVFGISVFLLSFFCVGLEIISSLFSF